MQVSITQLCRTIINSGFLGQMTLVLSLELISIKHVLIKRLVIDMNRLGLDSFICY
jgi:hypothetical protein